MTDTKEQILQASLRLFARDGFSAVSVSAIAGELGITKGALYRHYASKRDIFDHILQRMETLDRQRAGEYAVPEEPPADGGTYGATTPEALLRYTLAQFRYWTADPFASSFRRLLTLEQYRSGEMAALYQNYLGSGPLAYVEELFRAMMSGGRLLPGEAGRLAALFYGPMYLYISLWDAAEDKSALERRLAEHLSRFQEEYFR